MPRKNHYELLEIPTTADQKTVKRAYRRMVRLYHPDSGTAAHVSSERFQEIIEAYNVLRDPVKRAQYDRLVNRPPIRVIESDWVYQPKNAAKQSKQQQPHSQQRPPASAYPYQPDLKTLAQRLRPFIVFPMLLVMAGLILMGIIAFTNAYIQPETQSLVATRAIVEQVQVYQCNGRDICYLVTYGYVVNGTPYQGSFSSEAGAYLVGDALDIQYYWGDPAHSVYRPSESGNNNAVRYVALAVLVVVVMTLGLYSGKRAFQNYHQA